jgi:hypothetical protein
MKGGVLHFSRAGRFAAQDPASQRAEGSTPFRSTNFTDRAGKRGRNQVLPGQKDWHDA